VAKFDVLFDNEDVIRRLGQQALANSLTKRLQRMPALPRNRDGLVDQVVERTAILGSLAGYNGQPAAPLTLQPFPSNKVLIRLANRVVMNLQPARQLTHAGHEFAVFEPIDRNKKNDLFRQLPP